MAYSDAWRGILLDVTFGVAAPTLPTGFQVGCSTTTPASNGTGITEPTDTAYARVTAAVADWSRTGNTVTNAVDLTFPTASVDWGAIVSFQLYDSLGALIVYDAAQSPSVTVLANQTLRIPAGQLSFTLT